jgi:hypothetical protein
MKAQAGCYAGGTTPRQSGPRPCMPGMDVTDVLTLCRLWEVIFSSCTPAHQNFLMMAVICCTKDLEKRIVDIQ